MHTPTCILLSTALNKDLMFFASCGIPSTTLISWSLKIHHHSNIYNNKNVYLLSLTTLVKTFVLLGSTRAEGTRWYVDWAVESKLTTSTWRLWNLSSQSWWKEYSTDEIAVLWTASSVNNINKKSIIHKCWKELYWNNNKLHLHYQCVRIAASSCDGWLFHEVTWNVYCFHDDN